MLFCRSPASQAGTGPSLHALRVLTLTSLAAYPAGGLLLALGPDGSGGLFLFEAIGLALITLALLAAAPVLGSRLQRIVGEEARQLDEYELQLRHRAISAAYATFTGMVCLALLYGALASDFGWWLPRSYDAFNAIFWGVFLYSTLLPTVFLAWGVDEGDLASS
jgi:hypothetical protein